MQGFSAREAALAGVRLVVSKPKAVLAWAVINFGAQIAVAAGTVAIGLATPGANFREPGAIALKGLDTLFLGLAALLISAVVWTAAFRAFLRPQASRFFYLRLGSDEVRMCGLVLLTTLMAMLAVPVLIPITLLARQAPGAGAPILSAVLILATPFVMARFVLAPALTLDQKRIRVWESWRLTRDHFLVIAGLLLANSAVSLLLNRGPEALWLAFTNPHGLMTQPMQAMRALHPLPHVYPDIVTPQNLLWEAYRGVVSAVDLTIWVGIAATAYAGLRDVKADEAA